MSRACGHADPSAARLIPKGMDSPCLFATVRSIVRCWARRPLCRLSCTACPHQGCRQRRAETNQCRSLKRDRIVAGANLHDATYATAHHNCKEMRHLDQRGNGHMLRPDAPRRSKFACRANRKRGESGMRTALQASVAVDRTDCLPLGATMNASRRLTSRRHHPARVACAPRSVSRVSITASSWTAIARRNIAALRLASQPASTRPSARSSLPPVEHAAR
jgi:hypothetical protein